MAALPLSPEIISALIAGLAAISTSFVGLLLRNTQSRERLKEQEKVESIADAIRSAGEETAGPTVEEWQAVQRLVGEYHEQALSQARVQFWFSVIAASAGFAMIVGSVVAAIYSSTSALQTFAQVVPGIAIEAVAALFFKQAGETRERATALYDRLRTDRQRTDALNLVDSIDNANVRNAVKAELVLHLVGLSASPLGQMLPALLSGGVPTLMGSTDSGKLQESNHSPRAGSA
jgi:hypothetical protein